MTDHIPLVNVGAQNTSIETELKDIFASVLKSSGFIGGPSVKDFEAKFAGAMGGKYGVGASSGTSALFVAYSALGVKAGDEVILPANTYVATAEAVVLCGGTPVFADVKEDDFLIDPESVKKCLSDKTKLLAPVHLFGQACDMNPLIAIAEENNLALVNDAAQAHMANYQGKSITKYAKASCYSFYPGKNLGALGDAGAVVTDDEELSVQMKLISDHGCRKKYHHEIVGYNERLDALQAAFLNLKLDLLPEWTKKRQENASRYDQLLEGLDLIAPRPGAEGSHVYHLYVIRVNNRDEVLAKLHEANIGAGIHYPLALTDTPAMAAYRREPCPVAEKLADSILSLPLFPELTAAEQEYVVDVLKKAL
jgi:dTDP-4-amino-4,6-dideoxygalactose transaminase